MTARRVERIENWRVEVTPEKPWGLQGEAEVVVTRRWRTAAEDVASAIRRHVDGVGPVIVECDRNGYCPDCGVPWAETDTTYNGGCCDADEKHNPAFSSAILAAEEKESKEAR